MSNQDWLDVTLTNIVRPMVGPRCKTTDKQDFPELADDNESRCLVCTTYEEIDAAKATIKAKIAEAELEVWKMWQNYLRAKETRLNVVDDRIAELEALKEKNG